MTDTRVKLCRHILSGGLYITERKGKTSGA